jgi:hypothetical protein
MNVTRILAGLRCGLWLTILGIVPAGLALGGEPKWMPLFDGSGPPPVAPRGSPLPAGNSATTKDGLLHLVDRSTSGGSVLLYPALWNADPKGVTECEAEVKLIAASQGPCGMCIDVADGVYEDSLSFYPDRIGLWYARLQHKMDTRSEFHTYRVRIAGTDIQVFVDGKLAIDGKGKFTAPAENGRNECQFGAGSSPDTGEALWRKIRFQIRPTPETKIVVPKVPGLDVQVGQTVLIQPDATYPIVFQFADGRISVGWGNYNPKAGKWSIDGGRTWREGKAPPDQASIELGGGEVLSLGFWTKKRPDGKYWLPQRRSLDGWKTVTEEIGVFDIPRSVPCGGDAAETNEGFLMDHSILRLKDGRLMAAMYGNYEEDKTPGDDYPASFHFNKYRTIVVFSSDKGKTWGNPVTVATQPRPAQEGCCEADLVRAANGDILCAMRSGGSMGKFTPCYLCRSSDEGQTWSAPQAILDRGVWPAVCVMRSGVVVCTTGRPGNWLVFSQDNGRTWHGEFCFSQGPASSYNSVVEVQPDTILVIYDRQAVSPTGIPRREIVGTLFTVKKK